MTTASPAERPAAAPRRILVWDAPVRVFHWLMVLCFAGAYATGDSERFRLLHLTLGYTMAGLVGFRLVWGLLGTHHARFASFVRGPRAAARYLASILRGRPEHHTGHNPAGALAIVALLALTLAAFVSGWAADQGYHALEDLHEGVVNAMLLIVLLHIVAVLASSWLHRENLVGAMLHGRKPGRPEDGIRRAWRGVAALMLVAVAAFWSWQWQAPPSAGGSAALQSAGERQHARGHDQGRDRGDD